MLLNGRKEQQLIKAGPKCKCRKKFMNDSVSWRQIGKAERVEK